MQTIYRLNEKDIQKAIAEYCINHYDNIQVIGLEDIHIHSGMTGLYENVPYYYAEVEVTEVKSE